jgi:hypothetical protein
MVKGIPNLRVYEILDGYEDVWLFSLIVLASFNITSQHFLKHIVSFKKLNTIILRPYNGTGLTSGPVSVPDTTIKKCITVLKGLAPTTDKRRMFISHEGLCERKNQRAGRQLMGDLTEVDLS